MAKNVKAVERGLCGQVIHHSNGRDYCILKPHSDAIGHTARLVSEPPAPQLIEMPEPHQCPEILVVSEEFYRTVFDLITSQGEEYVDHYADAVVLVAQKVKDGHRIPGVTAWRPES